MKLYFALGLAFCFAAFAGGTASAGETATITATSDTPEMPAYVARPPGGAKAPGVLVLHGCEGYGRAYSGVADWLAAHGYVAVAIDTLAPQGIRTACMDPSRGAATEAADARAALDWMRSQPYVDGAHLALLGYSMGAFATLDVVDEKRAPALPEGLLAAVVYYPPCRGRDAANVRVPLRILDGDADEWTPAAPCQALARAAASTGKTASITTYPGATHAFNFNAPDRVAFGHQIRYDATAAADSEAQTLDFLSRYLHPAS
jgi:dienelactone hydrolase